MNYKILSWDTFGVRAEIASFAPEGRTAEHHIMLHVEPRGELFSGQLSRLNKATELLLEDSLLKSSKVIYKRYFVSDAANQKMEVRGTESSEMLRTSIVQDVKQSTSYSISLIQQPPLDGSKVGVWIYMQEAEDVVNENGTLCVKHNGYEHLWNMSMLSDKGSSYDQTEKLLNDYEAMLASKDLNIKDHCIRTWFFVRDVDIQYSGMVVARKKNFIGQGMTENTHYVSSTGICGVPELRNSIIMLDAYALKGMLPVQQKYLYASDHLNRTSDYGVTFERGTKLMFGDRSHLYISGTASIDNKGNVANVGDIRKQTFRMWENVESLLAEGGATFRDVMQIIVYLRDICDYPLVSQLFAEKFPSTPYIITLAPVCRPQWLIEMECIAITQDGNQEFRDF